MRGELPVGQGVGLRATHYADWERGARGVSWAECITENYLDVGGRPRQMLELVRARMPLVLHGVSLSIAGTDPLDLAYLAAVKRLANDLEPAWVSDHLCWSSTGGQQLHDLLPIPYTEEALLHVALRVRQAQDFLGRPLVLENPSTYLAFAESTMTEWDFLAELAKRTDCGILLDVNNVYVSSRNHGFLPDDYLAGVPVQAVKQFHLAGHTDRGSHVIDTHDAPVADAVWALYAKAVARFGPVPTLLEWDASLPPFETVVAESQKAAAVVAAALGTAGAPS